MGYSTVPWHRAHRLCISGAAHTAPGCRDAVSCRLLSQHQAALGTEPSCSLYRQQALEEPIVMLMQNLPGLYNLGSLPFALSYPRLFFLPGLLLLWLLLTPAQPLYHLSSFSLGITRRREWLNFVFYLQDTTVCKLRELA